MNNYIMNKRQFVNLATEKENRYCPFNRALKLSEQYGEQVLTDTLQDVGKSAVDKAEKRVIEYINSYNGLKGLIDKITIV